MCFRFLPLLVLLPSLSVAQNVPDKVISVGDDDIEMNEAIEQARATLDDFLALSRSPPRGTRSFKLKVKFADENGAEHMWVTPFIQSGDNFSGVLANTPETVKNVQQSTIVHFGRADITDWGYVRDGKQFGSFTVCVMLRRMAPEEAKKYLNHGFQCQV